jgi:TetR/AcrR family transcriptional repressor of lmrAB and yxaGH operons
MLAIAETLLREGGLSGAGIQQLVTRSGTPIGSLYHHFPGGKTQLVAEALQLHAEKGLRLLERFFGDAEQPLPERLRALFRAAADGFDRAGADKGCAIGAVALDLDSTHDTLRSVCCEAFDQWTGSIAQRLPWVDAATRQSFAELIVASAEGAFVLSRARRSGKPFISVGEWLAVLAESHGGAERASGARGRRHPTRIAKVRRR